MKITKIIIVLTIILFFTTCKRYDKGGFVMLTKKHLFGGHKDGDHKTWKLVKYEVNGIDSTDLIRGANDIPDFYSKFITFTNDSKKSTNIYFSCSTFFRDTQGGIGNKSKEIHFDPHFGSRYYTHEDSTQCVIVNGINYCTRDLLTPEMNNYSGTWQIKKLTKHEMIIEINRDLKNTYKITLGY